MGIAENMDPFRREVTKMQKLIRADLDREQAKPPTPVDDPVNSPKHYTSHPSGIDCIEIARHMSFNLGNVFKYIWRADLKNGLQDLKKAAWYLADEIKRREGQPDVLRSNHDG